MSDAVRIGMHTGSPLPDGNDFIGQEVDYTARVSALASGGQILLSEVTSALVRGAQIAGLALHPHGDRDLKGIGEVPRLEVLGLVKRKQQSRIVGDVSPEQGSQLYEPEATEEITQRLEIDEFMVFSQSAETN